MGEAAKQLFPKEKTIQERLKEMNESGLFSQPVLKEHLQESDRKAPLYRVHEHSPEKLEKMTTTLLLEAQLLGGLPKHHSEVFHKRGWLLPFLMAYDQLLWGRWDYWGDILVKGTLEGSGPIPQIEWCSSEHVHQVKKMLTSCLDHTYYEGARIHEFADWLLWGLGATKEPPKISANVNEHWYKTFDLFLVLRYPTDYLSGLLEEASSQGYQQALGYYSTPFTVTTMMNKIVLEGNEDPETHKYESVYDGCVGCGAMLLPASNYTLFGCGQDISPIAVKLCQIQMLWYAPWYAINPFWEHRVKEGNALSAE